MSEVTQEMIEADAPSSELLGELFDDFISSESGKSLLDSAGLSESVAFVLRNRLRRAYEAGASGALLWSNEKLQEAIEILRRLQRIP